MKRTPADPFTIVRGGLHPDAIPAKPTKKEKYSPYQLQLIARLRRDIRADMAAHAERFWADQAAKKQIQRLAL